MTQYTTRISFTCPVASIDAGNEFMAWVGNGLGDRDTFHAPVDENGNPAGDYAVASGAYKPDFLSRLSRPIDEASRPEWGDDLDLALATTGQAMLQFEVDERTPTSALLAAKGKAATIIAPMKGIASDPDDITPWESGLHVEVGQFVSYTDTTYMCIQAHTTFPNWTPDVVPALYVVIPSDASVWQANVQYAVDDVVSYEGVQYKCRQAHTSLPGWEPPNVPALWLAI